MVKKLVFNDNDYNSGDGMLTGVWGPALWHTLHTMSFNYPVKPSKEQKKYYKEFFTNLQNVLPCKYCRDNYKVNLKTIPLTRKVLKNRDNFSRWVYDMHNLVNDRLGKKQKLTYDQVRDRYEHFRARCSSDIKANSKKAPNQKGGSINKNKHLGCTNSVYGVKARCKLQIVPQSYKGETLSIHNKCIGKHDNT